MGNNTKILAEVKSLLFTAIMETGQLSKKYAAYCSQVITVHLQTQYGGTTNYVPIRQTSTEKSHFNKSFLIESWLGIITQQCKISENVAKLVVTACADAFVKRFATVALYFPCGRIEKTAKRDKELIALFDGKNHREIAIKFGISIRQVYYRLDRIKNLAQKHVTS